MNSVNSFKDLQGPQNQFAWLSPINFPRRNYKKFFGHKSMLDRGDYKKKHHKPCEHINQRNSGEASRFLASSHKTLFLWGLWLVLQHFSGLLTGLFTMSRHRSGDKPHWLRWTFLRLLISHRFLTILSSFGAGFFFRAALSSPWKSISNSLRTVVRYHNGVICDQL